jgi:hypothetical protein
VARNPSYADPTEFEDEKSRQINFCFCTVLTAIAPSFSHTAYFVDETKTWAISDKAQDIMAKKSATRGVHAFAMVPRSGLTTYLDNGQRRAPAASATMNCSVTVITIARSAFRLSHTIRIKPSANFASLAFCLSFSTPCASDEKQRSFERAQ